MSNYRMQFLDAQPHNRGQAPSLTARADAQGEHAMEGVRPLPAIHLDLAHAQEMADMFQGEIARVGDRTRHHRSYQTLRRQLQGYIHDQPVLLDVDQKYEVARAPAYQAMASVARAGAIRESLGFNEHTDFTQGVSTRSLRGILREHSGLNQTNQRVSQAAARYQDARNDLSDKAHGFRRVLAINVRNELRQQIARNQEHVDEINARIARVTNLLGAVESGLSAFSGNLGGITGAIDHLDSVAASSRRGIPSGGQVEDTQLTPHERSVAHGRFALHARMRTTANDVEDDLERRRQRTGRGRAMTNEMARAARRGEEADVPGALADLDRRQHLPSQPSAPHDNVQQLSGVASTMAHGAGILSSSVERGMRLYNEAQLRSLQDAIHAATQAVSSWEEVRSREHLRQLQAEFVHANERFRTAADDYERTLATRRAQYQEMGRRLDEQMPGAAPTNQTDFNSQTMLYMSATREAHSRLGIATPAVTDAQTSANAARRQLAHRRQGYVLAGRDYERDSHEAGEASDERGVRHIQYAVRDWLREANQAQRSLQDEERSAGRTMARAEGTRSDEY